jgi:DNA-directed RNA polymerase subunit alpha
MAVLRENWNDLIKVDTVKVDEINAKEAVVTVAPLEKGYGITLGNALRRVLLTSIRGFAITKVKIDGVFHEYETIEGVREDVSEIIMNIKSILFSKETSKSSKLFIKVNRKGVVLAKDIKIENGGEILNQDLVICHLEKDVVFNAELVAEYGVGFVPAKRNEENRELGVLNLDAFFNPVRNVAYKITPSRIGQNIDYDNLELNIETNGTVSVKDVVTCAARILQTQLEVFAIFDTSEKEPVVEEDNKESGINQLYFKKLEDMNFSVRSLNCLKREKIIYLGDLVQRTQNEIANLDNFGKKSFNEVSNAVRSLDLSFDTKIDGWDALLEDFKNKK